MTDQIEMGKLRGRVTALERDLAELRATVDALVGAVTPAPPDEEPTP